MEICEYLLLHLSVEIFHKTFFKITNRLNMRKTFTGSDNSDHCSILSRKLLASQNWVTHAVSNYFGLDLNQLVVICQNYLILPNIRFCFKFNLKLSMKQSTT